MALSKEWTDTIKDPGKKKDFEAYVLNSSSLLDRLAELIEKYINEQTALEDKDDYSSPAWPMQMAARQGSRKAYNKILKLIDRS